MGKYGFTIRVKSNSETVSNPILLSQSHSDNPFMKAFLNNIIIRPSCSACPAKAGRSHSDVSMADFWGIKEISPKFYDKNGVSLIFAHNEKGNNIIKKLGGEQLEVSCKDVSITNISYSHSSPLHTNRTLFFFQMAFRINYYTNEYTFQTIFNRSSKILNQIGTNKNKSQL